MTISNHPTFNTSNDAYARMIYDQLSEFKINQALQKTRTHRKRSDINYLWVPANDWRVL